MYTGDLVGAQRPELHVFYVLDTSGSMKGNPIGVLNRAMRATVRALRQVAERNSNARVKIAVLEFNTTCRWVQSAGPEDLEHFIWDELEATGKTYLGTALDELNAKLHRGAFLSSTSGTFLPVIIFMTDGFANDDYDAALARIRQNKWFAKATRIGFAIGRRPDVTMIAKLTGDSEAVIRTDDLGLFATMLRFVSASSVSIASRSHTSDSETAGKRALRMAMREAGVSADDIDPGIVYHEDAVGYGGTRGSGAGGGSFSPLLDSDNYGGGQF